MSLKSKKLCGLSYVRIRTDGHLRPAFLGRLLGRPNKMDYLKLIDQQHLIVDKSFFELI